MPMMEQLEAAMEDRQRACGWVELDDEMSAT